ncbi:amidohydrolase [Solibaculum mannosilyticum]|uniref:Hydrolase n=1 Tax=Solibaculum mannosilyticum TaxID=2780922 RepID=A0A7I8D4Q3_9FIRM|nr:amidohydrolase [Solibaculum mannosilyticum]BCI60203.1 hydrolase [Solibaculum mannosilyticum]
MLIINAKIYTMAGSVVDNGWVQVNGGKIAGVRNMDQPPESSSQTIIDAKGKWLFPGFIDAHTHLGMWEDGLGFEGDDGNEDTDPSTPQLRAVDAINPMDYCFTEALEAGITTVITGPGSANAIGGQMAAIKTMGKRIDDMIVKAPVAMKFALGENPKTSYHGKSQSPVTRMATASIIREQLNKAKRYEEELQAAAKDPELEEPEYDAKCEALIPLFRKEIKAHFHAHRCDDIFTAIRIAKEFDLEYVIVHGTQGHKATDVLVKEEVDVLAGPVLCDRSKPELKDLTPANPGILDRAGIRTAVVTDHPVIPIQYLPLCAGLAVREGMDWESAIRGLTIVPAQICGIDRQVGSIEPGKDADLVLFDGDPLTLKAKPSLVICNGQIVRE